MPPRKEKYPFAKKYATRMISDEATANVNRAIGQTPEAELPIHVKDKFWQLKELTDRLGGISVTHPIFAFTVAVASGEVPEKPKETNFEDMELKYGDKVAVQYRSKRQVGIVTATHADRVKVNLSGTEREIDGVDVMEIVERAAG